MQSLTLKSNDFSSSQSLGCPVLSLRYLQNLSKFMFVRFLLQSHSRSCDLHHLTYLNPQAVFFCSALDQNPATFPSFPQSSTQNFTQVISKLSKLEKSNQKVLLTLRANFSTQTTFSNDMPSLWPDFQNSSTSILLYSQAYFIHGSQHLTSESGCTCFPLFS